MALFDQYTPRARRVIFYARYEAFRDRANSIAPEHLLRGLLREDPQLFALVAPQTPDLVSKLHRELAVENEDPLAIKRNDGIPLTRASKEIIVGAGSVMERLGHRAVATQHLLLSILVGGVSPTDWFRRAVRTVAGDHSLAQRVLKSHGVTADSVEAAIKEGIITPTTSVVDDSLVTLNAQVNALGELLISKSIFTRSEFVQSLDGNEGPMTPEAFLLPLLDALCAKGCLSTAERERIAGAGRQSDSGNSKS